MSQGARLPIRPGTARRLGLSTPSASAVCQDDTEWADEELSIGGTIFLTGVTKLLGLINREVSRG